MPVHTAGGRCTLTAVHGHAFLLVDPLWLRHLIMHVTVSRRRTARGLKMDMHGPCRQHI